MFRCPNCKSPKIIKKGKRKTKFGARQLFYCKDCCKGFADSRLMHKTYGPKIITSAITYYNLGYSEKEAAKRVNKRYKVKLSRSTVNGWLKEYEKICTYRRLRDQARAYGNDILYSKTFQHQDLSYNFKYHRLKLARLANNPKFRPLAEYIVKFRQGCPDWFNRIPDRCSQVKIGVNTIKAAKYNNACKLAELAVLSCRSNHERHSRVEDFMLVNDSSTVAVETPVWLYERSLDMQLSGHIDVLQVRGGKIYVMDYKPGAEKENVEKVKSQLYWYATGLSFRTKIPLPYFRCAWFDENIYYEFDPGQAVNKDKNKRRIPAVSKAPQAPDSGARADSGFRPEQGCG